MMMSPEDDNSVMFFNETAVSSMARGDHQECTKALESALRAYRGSLRQAEAEDQQEQQVDARHRRSRAAKIWIQSVPLPDCPSGISSQFGYNSLTVFSKAFVTVSEQQQQGPEDDPMEGVTFYASVNQNQEEGQATEFPGSEHVVPAMLLYNMALSFHTQSLSQGSTAALARAYQFYRHAALLLERAEAEAAAGQDPLQLQDDESYDGRRVLLAALANNMAHVSASMFHRDHTRASLKLLRNLVEDATTSEFYLGLQEDELDTFTMNWVFHDECADLAMASAA